jgi:threonine synthase
MDRPTLSQLLPHVKGLRCVLSGKIYSLDEVTYTSPDYGEVGTLDVIYEGEAQKAPTDTPLTMWRQRELLPMIGLPPAGLRVLGGSPLIQYDTLQHVADALKIASVCIKNDSLSLTSSLKDRASAVVVSHAVQNLGTNVIATASTGNAAAALAGVCAAVEHTQAVIFVPASAPEAKIAQMLIFGAKVILVDGDYDTAFDLCTEACNTFGWYNRSTGINPFTTEGKKTVVFEIAEQLDWQMPEVMVVSTGDGSIIGSVYKGLAEMLALGWIDQMPRLIGVQSAGSAALVHAWENGVSAEDMQPQPAKTVADSISSSLPRDRAKALRAVRESEGAFIRVSDEQILTAIRELARSTGVFAEPAAAATYAGLQAGIAAGHIHSTDRVLLLITGSGLKDIKTALKTVTGQMPSPTQPQLSAVEKQVKSWQLTEE